MTTVDWEAYQAFPVCPALLGEPCLQTTGWYRGDIRIEADAPHTGRKLRAVRGRG